MRHLGELAAGGAGRVVAFAKFGFYAARGVQEIWVVDPLEHTVRCWQLREGGYEPVDASALLGLRMDAVAAELDWP